MKKRVRKGKIRHEKYLERNLYERKTWEMGKKIVGTKARGENQAGIVMWEGRGQMEKGEGVKKK